MFCVYPGRSLRPSRKNLREHSSLSGMTAVCASREDGPAVDGAWEGCGDARHRREQSGGDGMTLDTGGSSQEKDGVMLDTGWGNQEGMG